jgi:hypothetical protein
MRKILLLLLLLTGVAYGSYAQSDNDAVPKLGVGFNFGAAFGSNSGAYPIEGGVHAKFEYPVSDSQLSIIFKAGYTFFVTADGYTYQDDGYGDNYSNGSILSFIPIEVGAKYYVAGRIFLEGEAGASFNLSSTDENGKSISKISPIVSPNVGYTIPFGTTRASLDLALGADFSPQTGGGYNDIALKATFNFGLN